MDHRVKPGDDEKNRAVLSSVVELTVFGEDEDAPRGANAAREQRRQAEATLVGVIAESLRAMKAVRR